MSQICTYFVEKNEHGGKTLKFVNYIPHQSKIVAKTDPKNIKGVTGIKFQSIFDFVWTEQKQSYHTHK